MTGTVLPPRRSVLGLVLGATALGLAACSGSPEGTVSPPSQPSAAATPLPSSATAGPATATPAPPSSSAPLAPGGPAAGSPALKLKTQYSLTDPTSPWVLVNKHNPLRPHGFAPTDLVRPALPLGSSEAIVLRAPAAAAAERMFAAAAAAGAPMTMLSGYRSYETQVGLYASYAAQSGAALADTYSARPGYSEHQTGLAMDIGALDGSCPLQYCFVQQPAAIWAAANAHRYGFILRYQLGHNAVTGFYAESWHYRYVGVELAADLVARHYTTLEEYFGKPAAPAYL